MPKTQYTCRRECMRVPDEGFKTCNYHLARERARKRGGTPMANSRHRKLCLQRGGDAAERIRAEYAARNRTPIGLCNIYFPFLYCHLPSAFNRNPARFATGRHPFGTTATAGSINYITCQLQIDPTSNFSHESRPR